MAKLLLLSVLIATFIVPLVTARDPKPTRGLTKTLVILALFNVLYFFAIKYIYPRLN